MNFHNDQASCSSPEVAVMDRLEGAQKMDITDKTVFITGANRGIGHALVLEALGRGARRVYAASRSGIDIVDPRLFRVLLDVTNGSHITAASGAVGELDLLINNAGVATYGDLANLDDLEQHLAVNLFGTLNVSRAFLPQLGRSHGAIVNLLSLAGIASVPVMPAYSISKAAALNLTQSLRSFLAPAGVRVHSVLLGPIDTDMTRGLHLPKTAPAMAARGIFDGLAAGDEDIFPDPASQPLADSWNGGVSKELERQFRAFMLDAPSALA